MTTAINKKVGLFLVIFVFAYLSLRADSLDEIKKSYIYGDYNEVIRLCLDRLEQKTDDGTLYFIALSFSRLGDYTAARVYFRRLLKEFKGSSFYEKALVRLVDTYFLEGDLTKAETLYKSIIKKYPQIAYKPLICLRLAQIYAKKGHWDKMHHYINIIKANYRGSFESQLAGRLEKRGDFFTIQVGAFSKKANALSFARQLRHKYPVYVVGEKENDFTLYKVRVGKYKNRNTAEKIFNSLLNDGYPARIYP